MKIGEYVAAMASSALERYRKFRPETLSAMFKTEIKPENRSAAIRLEAGQRYYLIVDGDFEFREVLPQIAPQRRTAPRSDQF